MVDSVRFNRQGGPWTPCFQSKGLCLFPGVLPRGDVELGVGVVLASVFIHVRSMPALERSRTAVRHRTVVRDRTVFRMEGWKVGACQRREVLASEKAFGGFGGFPAFGGFGGVPFPNTASSKWST